MSAADLAGLRHEHLLYFARRAYEQQHRVRPRRYGISSNAMVEFALGIGPEPKPMDSPVDREDLAACQLAFDTAPTDLQPAMLPTLRKYEEQLSSRGR